MTTIDIYSGFLGAGKTTLIKKMIKEAYTGEKIVLIENEFGEIGIDGGFMQEAGIQVNEMNSGCICCSLVGDFSKALQQVISEYQPDRILIEPSGVGKLSDVIAAVQRSVGGDVQLGCFVTVADATKCKVYLKNFGEFYSNQIETASAIILSRTATIAEDKLDTAVSLLRAHNKEAAIITTPWEELTGAQILEAMRHQNSLTEELAEMIEHEHHHHDDEECDDPDCSCHHHHHHHDGDEDEEHEHHHHHEHEEDEEHEHHHHHEHEEDEEHEHHHHHDGGEEHHHHHDEGEEHHHHHHHGHDADEIFQSWGVETHKKYSKEDLNVILSALDSDETYGIVLRAKGIVQSPDGTWLHFDHVPGEIDVRNGTAAVTGRLCVIGSKLNKEEIATLFGV
ncbi:MAG: GTP-binding protein [Oscillospiraceae bacterium]|nr:GTP-binding protein [Oscillospiraceae bacterium]